MSDNKYGHPRFYELTTLMEDIHTRKNQNYSKDGDPLSNFRMCTNFGISPFLGCLVRISDKWSRLQELAKGKPDVVGESMTDTLIDLANYSLLAIILWEESQKNEGK